MTGHEGGCLCGELRYAVDGEPRHTTVCHCRFCQKATGSAYMVEPIFPLAALHILRGTPAVYTLRSAGSGKEVHSHFCRTCATRTHLTFERWPDTCGIYAGTFDDPAWFPMQPDSVRHIFTALARPDTVLPAGVRCFAAHTTLNDEPEPATVHAAAHLIGR